MFIGLKCMKNKGKAVLEIVLNHLSDYLKLLRLEINPPQH